MIELNSNNFNDEVINSDVPVLVDFYADWCGPCRAMRPILEEISSSGKKLASLNVDLEDGIAANYGISSIPCLILFKDGKEVKRSVGLISKSEVEQIFND